MDSVKKESKEALLYNKKESFFPRTNSKEGASALLGVERVRGKNDSVYCMIEPPLILFSFCHYQNVEDLCNEYAIFGSKTILK